MDQFVLTTSGGLNSQLEHNLERSATAVLIWSERSEESQWCKDEYDALRTLEKNKPGFRYVVACVDKTDVPMFAQAKLWIDFSALPDGPTGTGLLRLLHGKPLSDEAVRFAAAYDEAVLRAVAKVATARKIGDAEILLELVTSDAPEWTSTALLPCKVAEALIALKRPADAVDLLDELMLGFPRSVRPQQLKGLALARQGDWRAAQQVLGELHELGERDPETLGILARTWRDRFAQSGDRLHLRKARNLYAAAVEDEPESKGSHESSLGQARRLMDKLARSTGERAAIEQAFGGG